MTGYERQIASAKRMIDARGGDCEYLSHVSVPSAPDEPWRRSGVDPISYPVKAVVLPGAVTGKAVAGTDHTGTSDGPIGTHKAYIAGASFPADFQVQTDDKLVDASGQTWQVQKGWQLAPDGTSILFTLELRA